MEINGINYALRDVAPGTILLASEEDHSIDVSCHVFLDEKYSDDKFLVLPIYTGFKGQRQSAQLKLRPSGETFGYIFPVSSLVDDESFEADDKFRKIYAYAAVRHALLRKISPSLMRLTSGLDVTYPILFTDIFDDNYALCVVGRHLIEKYNIDESLIPTMLLSEGFFVPRDTSIFREQNHNSKSFQETFTVGQVKHLKDVNIAGVLLRIMQEADATDYLIGAFITYFQIIEILCDEIFSKIMSTIPQGIDPWTLREKVTHAANSKVRAQILFSQCGSGVSGARRDGLKDACALMLSSLSKDVNREDYVSNLVDIRNMIVHSQKNIINGEISLIQGLNSSLRAYLCNMIGTYCEYDGSLFWAATEPKTSTDAKDERIEVKSALVDTIKSVPSGILAMISARIEDARR